MPMAHTHLLGDSFAFTSVLYSWSSGYKVCSQIRQHQHQACQEGRISDPTLDRLNPNLHFYQNSQVISMHIKLEKNCWNT